MQAQVANAQWILVVELNLVHESSAADTDPSPCCCVFPQINQCDYVQDDSFVPSCTGICDTRLRAYLSHCQMPKNCSVATEVY